MLAGAISTTFTTHLISCSSLPPSGGSHWRSRYPPRSNTIHRILGTSGTCITAICSSFAVFKLHQPAYAHRTTAATICYLLRRSARYLPTHITIRCVSIQAVSSATINPSLLRIVRAFRLFRVLRAVRIIRGARGLIMIGQVSGQYCNLRSVLYQE